MRGGMSDNSSVLSVLEAMAAVARRRGVDTTAGTLSRSYAISGTELGVRQIVGIARDIGLDAKRIKVRWSDLPSLARALPAILRFKDGHALVLEGVLQGQGGSPVVVLHDPTAGPE